MTRRRIITIVIIRAVIAGGYCGSRAMRENAEEAMIADLQTEKIQMGGLEASVGATGTVRANQSAMLAWKTTGKVDEVFVALGESVSEGQTLATLRKSSLPQNVILAQADLVNAQNALDDLLASYNNDLTLAQAEYRIATARQKLDDLEEDVDNINYVGSQEDIDKAARTLEQARRDKDDAKDERDRYNANSQAYKIADLAYRAAYKVYSAALGNYNYLTGNSVDNLERDIIETDLEVARQELADAEADYQDLLDGPDAEDVAAAEARVAAAQASLELAWIEAPFDGMITMAEPLHGDEASVGTPAFRVDDLSRMLVDVQVSEVDINRVEIDQPVVLSFDAILATEYSGRVIQVSPVGNIVNGVVNFDVTIELDDPDERVRPGMTAAVNIVVSQLENVLMVPNRAVRVVNGERVVYILKNNALEMVSIELGASADLYSEVTSGDLKAGDDVVLNPPAEPRMFGGGGPPF